jgi:hypothetical protein
MMLQKQGSERSEAGRRQPWPVSWRFRLSTCVEIEIWSLVEVSRLWALVTSAAARSSVSARLRTCAEVGIEPVPGRQMLSMSASAMAFDAARATRVSDDTHNAQPYSGSRTVTKPSGPQPFIERVLDENEPVTASRNPASNAASCCQALARSLDENTPRVSSPPRRRAPRSLDRRATARNPWSSRQFRLVRRASGLGTTARAVISPRSGPGTSASRRGLRMPLVGPRDRIGRSGVWS